ncbi:MAG: efflux RND transporter periplasmic adaptor subunit [Bacteroides sp.]|nr:efflux RND transporter periplasmic adaptor subunit [Bacteroides sp.]
MKKIFFMGVMGIFLLGSCSSQSGHNHEGHDHESHNHATEEHGHNHASHNHEGHDHAAHNHEGHNHAAHNHEGHDHTTEGHKVHNHDHAAHGHGNNPDEIILAPEKAKAAGVMSEVIEPKGFRQVIATSGQIQAAQGAESVVVANVSGVVSFQRAMTDGASVGKGATILSISADKLQDGDPAERARIAYETAKAEYDRAQRLVGNQIISQKEFNAIKETYENARLSYEALSKNKSTKGVAVTAPIGGYIKNLLVKEGDFVTVGQPLLTVTQNNRLYLRADVSERYYRYLNTISSANFKTPYDNQVYELSALNGKLLSYGKASGDGSYYVPVTFSFDNKGDVVPGSFVEVFLMSKELPNTLAIPVEALTEEQGLYFVYLQKCAESYKKQEVKIGASNGKEVQILEGLHAGDRVVVKGAYHVKLASASNALPAHSHEH